LNTLLWKVEPDNIDISVIEKAARILQEGGLVAFPTETVYGLGADGLNPRAVARIFAAKGRPQDNPLILHVAEHHDLDELVEAVPAEARLLIARFWPGPLTLVLPKKSHIPPEVTAGLATVAVRMPDHPAALALIKMAGVPVAAPSANRSGYLSPTRAEHVLEDLGGRIEAVLDAGPTGVGLESTVLDLSGEIPVILRPGGVTAEQLSAVLGPVQMDKGLIDPREIPKAPGMKYRHYSPRAEVVLIDGDPAQVAGKIRGLLENYARQQKKVGLLLTAETWQEAADLQTAYAREIGSRRRLEEIAQNIYGELRRCDQAGVDVVLTETYTQEGLGSALMNRLLKSAGYRVIGTD